MAKAKDKSEQLDLADYLVAVANRLESGTPLTPEERKQIAHDLRNHAMFALNCQYKGEGCIPTRQTND